jgi:uroporphyrinogen-III synthase
MPLTALITRPEEDARALAEALDRRGVTTLIEPLLAIRPLTEAAQGLARALDGVQALLFTSANGARAFAELSPRRDIGVLAVGDATAAAARALGFVAVESAGGDVKDLARLARERLRPAAGPLFHAAGTAVAGDLSQLLGEAGFELRRRVLYESRAAESLTPTAHAALAHGAIDLVLLFSPRTAATFGQLAKAAGIDLGKVAALCLSQAVAESVRELPWRKVETAARPDLPAMLDLVERQLPVPATPAQPAESGQNPITPVQEILEPEAKMTAEAAKPEPPPREPPEPSTPPPPNNPAQPARPPNPAQPPKPEQPARRGGGWRVFLAGLIGAVLAAGAVLAVLRYVPDKLGIALGPRPQAATAAAIDSAAAQRLAALAARLAGLEQQIAALPKPAPGAADLPDRIAAAQQQLIELEGKAEDAAKAAADAAAKAQAARTAPAGSQPAPLPAEIAALPGKVADLEGKLAARPPSRPPADLRPLQARLGTLEQHLDPLAARLDGLEKSLGALDTRLAAAEQGLAGTDQRLAALARQPGGAADLQAVKSQLAQLSDRLKAVESDLATLAAVKAQLQQQGAAAGRETSARAGLALAVQRLGRLIDDGRPFAPELGGLAALAGADPALKSALVRPLDALKPAAAGVPSLADLRAGFPAAADAVLKAAAGGPAVAPDAGLGTRVLARLSSLVSIHRVADEQAGEAASGDPAALVGRAQRLLGAGDLAGAVKALEQLPAGKPADAARPWLEQARARLAAEQGFAALQSAAADALAAQAGSQ